MEAADRSRQAGGGSSRHAATVPQRCHSWQWHKLAAALAIRPVHYAPIAVPEVASGDLTGRTTRNAQQQQAQVKAGLVRCRCSQLEHLPSGYRQEGIRSQETTIREGRQAVEQRSDRRQALQGSTATDSPALAGRHALDAGPIARQAPHGASKCASVLGGQVTTVLSYGSGRRHMPLWWHNHSSIPSVVLLI